MDKEYSEILALNKRYWYGYQSPKVCVLGSDGVGHDNIHPADQLQSACRNAAALYHAAEDFKDSLELKKLDIEELEQKDDARSKILLRQAKRQYDNLKLQYEERKEAFESFYKHVKEIAPKVTARYDHIDEALPEIWAARIAYSALVKNHPLGLELKTAPMTEEQKSQLMSFLRDTQGFPSQFHTPNADRVMETLEGAKGWLKITGSNSDRVTHEQTQD